MSDVSVMPVCGRRQRKQFLNFCWQLYRDDPNWIPPLRFDQEELVGYRRHPFYERNRAQTFLAYRGGEVCGRVAAIFNQDHIDYRGDRRGFFGFFECIDDQQVADALLDAVKQWFAEQGIHSLRGPTNPGLNYVWGVLIEGFDGPPTFMMAYNPPYYARLIEGCGFHKSQDLYAYWGNLAMLPARQAKLGPLGKQIIAHLGIRLRGLDRARFREEVETFLTIYNRSMVKHWGFVPMSPGEVRHLARALRYLIVPEMTAAAEIDGQTVGAVFALPDYNPRIKQIAGRLFPFGLLRLLRNKRQIKKIRVVATNVVPEYQRLGVGLVLLQALIPKSLEWGIEEAEFSWVAESNDLSRHSLEKGGAKRIRTYRVYDWEA